MLLCCAAAMAQSVQTDYDRNFNLANLKSFSFHQQERGPRDPLTARVWDYVSGLKPGDVIAVRVLRAGEIVELKTSLPAR